MITINSINDLPDEYALLKHNNDGTISVYFDSDQKTIEYRLEKKCTEKTHEIYRRADKEEKLLASSKEEFKGVRESVIAGVGHRGKSQAETKQKFKDMVNGRQAIQDKRDNLLEQINSAITIEEVEAVTWD